MRREATAQEGPRRRPARAWRPLPYADSRLLAIATLELDPPGNGEVLVRIAAPGLCPADRLVINGDGPRPVPMVPGHEAAGIVAAPGTGVDDPAVGDHVVTISRRVAGIACRAPKNDPRCAAPARRRMARATRCRAHPGCTTRTEREADLSALTR